MISVIIPVFNAEAFLKESIQSILAQTRADLQIIICNDASTDRSQTVIDEFQDHRLVKVKNETNHGYLKTINKMLKMCTGDFIAFHDADDISHPKRFELQLEYLTNNPTVSLVGTNFNIINEHGKELHAPYAMHTDADFIQAKLIEQNLFQKPSVLFRRKVYETIGGFREGFLKLKNISEDYDWLLRASENFRLANVNYEQPLYSYRSVGSAMSKGYINLEQHIGAKVAQYLARERRTRGMDSLQTNRYDVIFDQIEILKKPYSQDRSLFYFEKAEACLYYGLYKQGVNMALRSCLIHPWKWRNVRSFLANLRRLLSQH